MTDVLETPRAPKAVFEGRKRPGEQTALVLFIIVPFVAFLAAIPVAWGGWLNWTDVIMLVGFYFVGLFGVTVGFHRYFTHGGFKANRPLEIALAMAGSTAVEGPLIRWVADHRRHHAYSDREGDPHSPWRFGESTGALVRGLWWAHIGWLFDEMHTNREKYAPDLMADPTLRRISRYFWMFVVFSLGAPAVIGGLMSWSWQGALEGFFWGSLVRLFLLHHVTWSINSICHVLGSRPFVSRDRSANFWPLAVLSGGESWHNLHHADPTAARHGVLRGQIDASARIIWIFEKVGWASDVRWPKPERLAKLRVGDSA